MPQNEELTAESVFAAHKKIVLTAQREAADAALTDIKNLDEGAKPIKFLCPEARLVSLPGGFELWAEKIQENPLAIIFARHIFPVQYEGELVQAADGAFFTYLAAITMPGDGPFSVQLRVEPRNDAIYAQSLALLQETERWLTERGFTRSDKLPAWAVSIFVHNGYVYAGVSRCAENLSAWNGGERKFKKNENFICRAGFKLLEAWEVFSLGRPVKNALDLGAAPGGWTQILLERGCHVTAVDPAELHENIKSYPLLTHIKTTAQNLSLSCGPFDIITNDMRIDLYESCRIMLGLAGKLAPGGAALMTLKLTPGRWRQKTRGALALLEQKYRVLGARQLFHNRDEVTVYMTLKN